MSSWYRKLISGMARANFWEEITCVLTSGSNASLANTVDMAIVAHQGASVTDCSPAIHV
jgi:hypothetical protein